MFLGVGRFAVRSAECRIRIRALGPQRTVTVPPTLSQCRITLSHTTLLAATTPSDRPVFLLPLMRPVTRDSPTRGNHSLGSVAA
jgi:hypothetical protein